MSHDLTDERAVHPAVFRSSCSAAVAAFLVLSVVPGGASAVPFGTGLIASIADKASEAAKPAPDPSTKTMVKPNSNAPGSLAQQLNKSNGVITPPANIDSGIQKPTPNTGPQSMPVVPPPGTPQNQPNIQPK